MRKDLAKEAFDEWWNYKLVKVAVVVDAILWIAVIIMFSIGK